MNQAHQLRSAHATQDFFPASLPRRKLVGRDFSFFLAPCLPCFRLLVRCACRHFSTSCATEIPACLSDFNVFTSTLILLYLPFDIDYSFHEDTTAFLRIDLHTREFCRSASNFPTACSGVPSRLDSRVHKPNLRFPNPRDLGFSKRVAQHNPYRFPAKSRRLTRAPASLCSVSLVC